MTKILTALQRHWQTHGIAQGPPVSAEDLAAFEAHYGVRLPDDLRAYFVALNGTRDSGLGPWDDELLGFWHLADVRSLAEEWPDTGLPDASAYFIFADHNLRAHDFAVRLSPDAAAPTPVFAVCDGFLVEVAPSFRAFLEGCVTGNLEMIYPNPPPAWIAKHGHRRRN